MNEVLIQVKGLVQGVFYRAHIKKIADDLGLTGWVKNNSDGTVTVCAGGEKEKLEQFIEYCKTGSNSSKVENINTVWEESSQKSEGFRIL